MLDQYSRNIDYIRISVTDRCNLRCIYCMPQTRKTYLRPVSYTHLTLPTNSRV